VGAGNTAIDVDWKWYADLTSLGVTTGIAALVEAVSQAFIHYIAQTEIAGTIENGLNAQFLRVVLDGAHTSDKQARTFVLTSVTMDENGLAVGVCPLPPKPPTPPPKQGQVAPAH
jgi:hypothetical protein